MSLETEWPSRVGTYQNTKAQVVFRAKSQVIRGCMLPIAARLTATSISLGENAILQSRPDHVGFASTCTNNSGTTTMNSLANSGRRWALANRLLYVKYSLAEVLQSKGLLQVHLCANVSHPCWWHAVKLATRITPANNSSGPAITAIISRLHS